MSTKDILYYKHLLRGIIDEIRKIENDSSYNLTPEKKQLDILEKKIEYKKMMKEIAILEHKDEEFIKKIDEELLLYSKKLISFREALGYKSDDLIRYLEKETRK